MSIRVSILFLVVAVLLIYAWKDWFKSLCGLVLLMAIIEHEDVPKTMFGIQGLNPWNVLFAVIVLAWAISRAREGLTWDMPRHVTVLLLLYLGVILVGVARAMLDRSYIEHYPLKSLVSEELINTIKWALPGLLLFDGCRNRRRLCMALACLLAVYFVVAVQVGRFMPPSAAFSDAEALNRSRLKLAGYIGYSACDISAMLAGASWAILATLPLVRRNAYRIMGVGAACVVAYGQALTGGRAGFLAWGVAGLTLCLLKWRKYLILAPVVIILLPIVFPVPTARMLAGFNEMDITGESTMDDAAVTSDRTEMWPYVIDKIGESPLIGYGRLAMLRTGLANQLLERGLSFPHPHNVYLEVLFDNGVIGSLPIFAFWGIVVVYSAVLFRSKNRLYTAVGGVTLALTLAQAVAGIGAQHYYPRVSTLGLWVATLLMFRARVEEARAERGVIATDASQDVPLAPRLATDSSDSVHAASPEPAIPR